MLVLRELSSVPIFCTLFPVLYSGIIYQCGEYSLFCVLDLSFDLILQQESIPVGSEPPVCYLYVLHNEQVRSKLNVSGGGESERGWEKNPCTVRSRVLGGYDRSHRRGSLYSDVRVMGSLYGEVQCLMGKWSHGTSQWIEWRTDTSENITFPHLRWRVVTMLQSRLETGLLVFCVKCLLHSLWGMWCAFTSGAVQM